MQSYLHFFGLLKSTNISICTSALKKSCYSFSDRTLSYWNWFVPSDSEIVQNEFPPYHLWPLITFGLICLLTRRPSSLPKLVHREQKVLLHDPCPGTLLAGDALAVLVRGSSQGNCYPTHPTLTFLVRCIPMHCHSSPQTFHYSVPTFLSIMAEGRVSC